MMHLTKNDMRAFDRALHQTILEFHPNAHVGCFAYAMLGAMMLNKVIGGHVDFMPQMGGRTVKVSPGDKNGPYCLTLDSDVVRDGGREFHCWIARKSTEEIIDFSTRYLKAEADLVGVPWERKPMPDFIWHRADRVFDDLWISYSPDEEMCRGIQEKFVAWHHHQIPLDMKASIMPIMKRYQRNGGNMKGLSRFLLKKNWS